MLFGIPEVKFNLETQFVVVYQCLVIQFQITAEKELYRYFSIFANCFLYDHIQLPPFHRLAAGLNLISFQPGSFIIFLGGFQMFSIQIG